MSGLFPQAVGRAGDLITRYWATGLFEWLHNAFLLVRVDGFWFVSVRSRLLGAECQERHPPQDCDGADASLLARVLNKSPWHLELQFPLMCFCFGIEK